MARKKIKAVLYGVHSSYIDPHTCESTVGFRVTRSQYGYLCGDIKLTSCDKQISWSLDKECGARKLEVAIVTLQKALAVWRAAVKAQDKKKGRRRAKAI